MDETQGLVKADQSTKTDRKDPRPARPVLEVVLCAVSSLLTIFFPAIATAAMVYGAWLLTRREEGRAVWAAAACLVPGVALSFVSWDYGSLVLPCSIVALVVAQLLPGRVNITTVCLTVVLSSGLMVAADASLVMLLGESFAAYVQALLEEIRLIVTASLTTGTPSVAVTATVDRTVELLGMVWPLIYVSRGAVVVVGALVGLMIARRDTYQRVYQAFTRYDMPLWGVVLLIASLLGFAAEAGLAQCPEVVGVAALNVLLCLRVLFFIQGLAVGMSVMDARHWGPVCRVVAITAMLLAEMGLCAVCVFGVLDVWANFRRLARKGACGRAHGEGE